MTTTLVAQHMTIATPEVPGTFNPAFNCADETPAYYYTGFRGNIADVLNVIKGINDYTVSILDVKLLALNIQLDELEGGYPIYFELPGAMYHYVITMWCDRIMIEVCKVYDGSDDEGKVLSIMWPETTQQALMALTTIMEDCNFPVVQPKPEETLSVLRELLASR